MLTEVDWPGQKEYYTARNVVFCLHKMLACLHILNDKTFKICHLSKQHRFCIFTIHLLNVPVNFFPFKKNSHKGKLNIYSICEC